MTATLPAAPLRALYAAMTATKQITTLHTFHWARDGVPATGGLVCRRGADPLRVAKTLNTGMRPWFVAFEGLFPGLFAVSGTISISLDMAPRRGQNPPRLLHFPAFSDGFVRYGAEVMQRILAAAPRRDSNRNPVFRFEMDRTSPATKIAGESSSVFHLGGSMPVVGKLHEPGAAAWLAGIDLLRIYFEFPALSAHGRAGILRQINERTEPRHETDGA